MLIYGATAAATGLVEAAIAANPGLYGQGEPAAIAPKEDRVRAGLELLTAHGFRLNRIHETGQKIDFPKDGFAYEGTVVPPGMRFSGLPTSSRPRHYYPDCPADYEQFTAARLEADRWGYQFCRAHMPFGPAEFIVDGIYPEPNIAGLMMNRQIGRVRMYNPYSGDGSPKKPYEEATLTIRRYLDCNPEFAAFAGFTQGWRSKPQFQWTIWDMLEAQSDWMGFFIQASGDWRLDREFGLTSLISDPETRVLSFIHPDGRRTYMTLTEALRQVRLKDLPEWKAELSPEQKRGLRNSGYWLDPEDVIIVNPILEMKWHGMSGSVSKPRKLY